MGFFDRLKQGLSRTKKGFIEKVESIFTDRAVDDETLEELEETLILSDVGANSASEIVGHLRERAGRGEISESGSVKEFLKKEMVSILGGPKPLVLFDERPFVILAIGVNGVGKTTTIGKLASRLRNEGNTQCVHSSRQRFLEPPA